MAFLTETSVYEAGIYQKETTDPVLGGANGIANLAEKQLANRTKWIYDQIVTSGVGAEARQFSGDLDTLRTPAFVLVRSSATNLPFPGVGHLLVTGRLVVPEVGNAAAAVQMYFSQNAPRIFFRFLAGSTWTAWASLQTTEAAQSFQNQFSGMVGYFATNTAPTGWLKANGAAVSRTVYSTLFGRVGTTFGAGNGTTTFNLPDLRGEFIRAWDDGRGADPSRIFGSAASGSSEVANHWHAYDKLTNLVTRYINDLGAGNGDPVIFGTQTSTFTTVQVLPSPLGEETAPRNVALLACIKY